MIVFLVVFVLVVSVPVGYVMWKTRPWIQPPPRRPVPVVFRADPEQLERIRLSLGKVARRAAAIQSQTSQLTGAVERLGEAMRSPYPPADDQKGKAK